MLDKYDFSLLNNVNELCPDGKYKIIAFEDFSFLLPEGVEDERLYLSERLLFLARNGYIAVKYSEKGTYCVSILPSGKILAERRKDYSLNYPLLVLICFISSFLGSSFAVFLGILFKGVI